MVLPQTLPIPQETSIASFDFVDIATGTGYIEYFAGQTVDLSLLNSIAFYCNTVITNGSTNSASAAKVNDVDFDLKVTIPLIIEGRAIVSVPIMMANNAISGADLTTYIIAKFRKWDGTTETTIVSNQSTTLLMNEGVNTLKISLVTIDLDIPRTVFKSGDIIRLTIEQWGQATGTTAVNFAFGHDPKGRSTHPVEILADSGTPAMDFGDKPSTLNMILPFKVDR